MHILSDDTINELIVEEKNIPNGLRPLSKLVERNKHKGREYDLTTTEAGNSFVIIVRQSLLNTFDFSAILGYKVPGLNVIFRLRRYNGKSHPHTNAIENNRFRDFHIHTATERYQKQGHREDHFAVVDSRYCDLNGAIDCLLLDCGFRSPIVGSPLFTGKPI